MIPKLRTKLNLKPTSVQWIAPMLIIILYLGAMSNLHAFQNKPTPPSMPFTEATEALIYDFNECASFSNDNSPWDYSEFTAAHGTSCSSITGGQIYRHDGKHSCTDDEQGNAGDAACFQSSTDNNYTANHTLAIRVDIELTAENGKSSRLDGISFKQLAPDNYKWSNTGFTAQTGPNNHPTKFGIRVLKDGSEIYRMSDLATTQTWYTSEFNFNHDLDFIVSAGNTNTFTFELFSYAPVGNGAAVSAWDLDDLKIFSSCEDDCNLTVDAGEDQSVCIGEEVVLTANVTNEAVCAEITNSYKIIDSNTEAGCFTANPGVIFQKYAGCNGIEFTWRAGADLILNEYDNGTAAITGTVIDQNGRVGTVEMSLTDKEHTGTTWNAACYLDGISGPETFYRSFNGAVTVDGVAYSVGTRFNAHYILADGAGFDSNQFGLGAWTGGAFGECTEWFGNLVPMTVDNSTQEIDYLWSTGETTQSITVTESGEYTVTVSDCKGCSAEDKVEVTILEPQAYVLDGGDSFCIDGEADFLTDNTIKISGDISGTNNTFVVTDAQGKILGLPETLNAVKQIDFDGAGAGTCLVWHLSFEDGLHGAIIDANANDLEGCFKLSNPIQITRNIAPTADAGADVSICSGEEIELIATGGESYLWSTGETTALINVSPTTNTTYTVTVTSAEGCEATDEVTVSLNAEVVADAGADVSICSGEEAMLTATGGESYLWSTGETTASIKVSPTANTTYTVTVTSAEGCEATDEVVVNLNAEVVADAGADVSICSGEEAMLTATGGESYLWSTGETTALIKVSPTANTTYTVTVTSAEGCEAIDEVMVTVDEKVVIGDFVWLDENRNGIQDDGAAGINDVQVTLYTCADEEVASTMTTNSVSGESGFYSFEVCPNSGDYYIVFGEASEELEFTTFDFTVDSVDSDADENGKTACFTIAEEDNLTIDAGFVEICNLDIDAGEDTTICEGETIELTADIIDNTAECPGVCVYPIKTQDRCYGPTGDFEIYLVSTGSVENFKFKASQQNLVRSADGTMRYTATASNGKDVIEVDAMFTGYTAIAPVGSPKANSCQSYDGTDWEYWTTWSGTITSQNHGVFNLSVKGAAFQMGEGADVVRTGYGASGWFYVDGGDGFYSDGDIDLALDQCVEEGVQFKWTTEDGNIVGSSTQRTIQVDSRGTYTVEAINCIDCTDIDTIKVIKGSCYIELKKDRNNPKMSSVYPIPVQSGGTLTIEFNILEEETNDGEALTVIPLKGSVDYIERKEDVGIMLYDITGRMISIPRTFKIENGKAIIYLDLDHIPSGKYILRAQGPTWSDAKNILVK